MNTKRFLAACSFLVFSQLSAATTRDSDNNGLWDDWEIANFGSTGVDPLADHDNDGQNAEFEMLHGTDPNNPASQFQTTIETNPTKRTLAFSPLAGERLYTVEKSEDLAGWEILASGTAATLGSAMHLEDPDSTSNPAFFRVRSAKGYSGSVYFISNEGNDTNDGLSPKTAWKTIEHVNDQSFSPGDAVLFRASDTWREVLRMNSAGSSEAPITFGSYGSGPKPKLLGSEKITSWSQVSGDVWASASTITRNPRSTDTGAEIFFEEIDGTVTWGHYETYNSNFTNLTNEYDWAYSDGTIYIHSPSDPNTRYTTVEAPQERYIVLLLDKNHLVFENLTIHYAINGGIYDQYATIPLADLSVVGCDIGYIGIKNSGSAYGLSVHRSNGYYGYNEIHDCGRRGISLTMYETAGITVENILVEYNHFYNGFHTTGVDLINGGPHTIRNVTIRNNFFEGNPMEDLQAEDAKASNHVFIHTSDSAIYLGDIKIYNNIFTYAHASAIKIEYTGEIEITSNTFYKFNLTIPNYQAFIYTSQPPELIVVQNNIFYNNYDNPSDNRLTDLKIDSGYENQFNINYNLYYHDLPNTRLYWCNGGKHYLANEWTSYTDGTGFDVDSPIPSNPLFADEANYNFDLSDGSYALNGGISISGVKMDYYGRPRNDPPDMGAIESDAAPPATDTEPPSVPTGLAASSISPFSVVLEWDSSNDNTEVIGYKVYTNGANPVNVTTTSTTLSDLSANTGYVFTVSAYDAEGNESDQSDGLNVTTAGTNGGSITEDFSSSASNFTEVRGTWTVNNGRYVITTPGSSPGSGLLGCISVHHTLIDGDFVLNVLMNITGNTIEWNDAVVIFGYQDSDNYCYMSLNESAVVDENTKGIFIVQNGTPTQLADITMDVVTDIDYNIRVERSGSTITAYVNDVLVATADDSTFTSGYIGVGSLNDEAQFDNFVVTQTEGNN